MVEKVIEKGLRYYDPKHQSITYILPNGMAIGKHLVIAVDPSSGMLKIVYTSRPNYFPKRLIPID